jgi:virulence-associated protein VapD
MFAIAFDLVVADTARYHPRGCHKLMLTSAIRLPNFDFDRAQGSMYTTPSEDLANLFAATAALKALPWLPESVRDSRAFRVEQ